MINAARPVTASPVRALLEASGLRVAIVHDWLNGMRGGEKVLEAMCDLLPEARIYTLLHDPRRVSEKLNRRVVATSWLQSVPDIQRRYKYFLPLMPAAVESLDVSGYDLVLSSSHCAAKGVRPRPGPDGRKPIHICYCHTPMRYIYDQFDSYFPADRKPLMRLAASCARPWLAGWDRANCDGVDGFIANSENVRARITEAYGRASAVIYPPVDTDFFHPDSATAARPFYLAAGALVPYKRVDLAILACRQLGVPLKIVGIGGDETRLRRLARGADVEFLGWRDSDELRRLYRTCAALLFPQAEDFGISAVEAMACGRPVIAFGAGGAVETVEDGKTGVLFHEQTAEALAAAILRAQGISFDARILRKKARTFDSRLFSEKLGAFLGRVLARRLAR